jgi:hypothetical protein
MAHTAQTLEAYIEAVDNVWRKWSDEAEYVAEIWYRGQADLRWPLLPGSYRTPFSKVSEDRYRHEFQLKALPFLSEATTTPASEWDWYFLMQHHGIPTRLLDWSESALVALYFAVGRFPDDADGVVWALLPRAVNAQLAQIGDFIPIYSDRSVTPYLRKIWDDSEKLGPSHPIAIDPPYNSRRLAAQRGKFTVHGSVQRHLEDYGELEPNLRSIRIPRTAKPQLRRQLFAAGITESVLFPGLDGLSREVRDAYTTLWAF